MATFRCRPDAPTTHDDPSRFSARHLGIGAGWYEAEHRAFGFPCDRRVSRLEDTLQALRPLMDGERISLAGRHLRLEGASVVTTAPAPPVWVGGRGQRMVALTARHGDGCNFGWAGPDPASFAAYLARVRAAWPLRAAFTASVGLLAIPVEDDERSRVLEAATPSAGRFWDPDRADERAVIGGPERLAAVLRAYEQAGAQHAILNLAVFPAAAMDDSYLERAAWALAMASAAG